jgi:hypothetical protein
MNAYLIDRFLCYYIGRKGLPVKKKNQQLALQFFMNPGTAVVIVSNCILLRGFLLEHIIKQHKHLKTLYATFHSFFSRKPWLSHAACFSTNGTGTNYLRDTIWSR